MISRNRYFLYCALLLLAPEVATANLILPMISFTFPAMCIMLIAVILVEFFVLTRRWSVRQGKCIKIQLVKIQPMQRLTTGIEAIIALREVTNVMKPIKATY